MTNEYLVVVVIFCCYDRTPHSGILVRKWLEGLEMCLIGEAVLQTLALKNIRLICLVFLESRKPPINMMLALVRAFWLTYDWHMTDKWVCMRQRARGDQLFSCYLTHSLSNDNPFMSPKPLYLNHPCLSLITTHWHWTVRFCLTYFAVAGIRCHDQCILQKEVYFVLVPKSGNP